MLGTATAVVVRGFAFATGRGDQERSLVLEALRISPDAVPGDAPVMPAASIGARVARP